MHCAGDSRVSAHCACSVVSGCPRENRLHTRAGCVGRSRLKAEWCLAPAALECEGGFREGGLTQGNKLNVLAGQSISRRAAGRRSIEWIRSLHATGFLRQCQAVSCGRSLFHHLWTRLRVPGVGGEVSLFHHLWTRLRRTAAAEQSEQTKKAPCI
jgi:hypothetical protein